MITEAYKTHLFEETRGVQTRLRRQNVDAYSRAARAAIAFVQTGDIGDQKTALIWLARSNAFRDAEQIAMSFVKNLEILFGEPIDLMEPLEVEFDVHQNVTQVDSGETPAGGVVHYESDAAVSSGQSENFEPNNL